MRDPSSRASGTASLAAVVAFCSALIAAAVISYFGAAERLDGISHPIAFNHRIHVEDQGLECSMCHPFYESQADSGMPGNSICSMCHLEPQGESAAERDLTAMLEAGEPLEWGRVFRQPPHVYYSHRRHVVVAGLTCELCHGDIGLSERPPTRAEPMSMDACLDCHRREQASADCTACHR